MVENVLIGVENVLKGVENVLKRVENVLTEVKKYPKCGLKESLKGVKRLQTEV